jgi:hypothetical protein
LAVNTQGSSGVAGSAAASVLGSGAGACSTMTCALVPLMPNDEMPARRGVAPAGQGWACANSSTAPAVQSTCGLGSSTCSVAGSTSWCIAMIILITPATPAAACV